MSSYTVVYELLLILLTATVLTLDVYLAVHAYALLKVDNEAASVWNPVGIIVLGGVSAYIFGELTGRPVFAYIILGGSIGLYYLYRLVQKFLDKLASEYLKNSKKSP